MKAATVQKDKTVKVEEKPIPTIAANEVLLKIVAAGLNPTDWKHVESFSKPGDITGCDFVGEVVNIGESVPREQFFAGQLRWGFTRGGFNPEKGAFSQYISVEWDLTSVVPPNITPQQAASIPIPFVTAVQILYYKLRIPEPPYKANGEWILIWSGATSVGRYAIQLARLSGLRVATTASEENWEKLKSYGAEVLVDYKDPEVEKKLKVATKDSIRVGIDCISMHGSIQQAQRAFGPSGGHLVTTLFDLGEPARTDVKTEPTLAYTLLGKDQKWGDDQVFHATPEERALYARWAKLATMLFGEGWIKPLDVDVAGPLDSNTVQKSLNILKEGEHGNKLVFNVA